MTQHLAKITPIDLLADAPPWTLVCWTRPHPNDIGVATVSSLSPGCTVPHVQSPARRCNVIGTFYEEDAAYAALDLATETLTTLTLFGTPAANGTDPAVIASVQSIRQILTLDLRELMRQGHEEHVKRLRGSQGQVLNREMRVIDLDGDAGDPAPQQPDLSEWASFGAPSMGQQDVNSHFEDLQASLYEGLGVPAELFEGEPATASSIRAAQEELARRSQRPPRDPRDAR